MAILGDLWVKLGLKKEGFDSGMKDAEKKTESFGGKVKKMGTAMKAAWVAASAVIVKKSAEIALNLTETAAKAEGIKRAFDKIADKNILEGLRAATRNTVSDVQLMQKTIQAANFGIPIEQLATYFKFATERAIQTGESVDYLVDSIVTGLGRKSVMILDNLGISAADIREEMAKGGDMAEAVGRIIEREMGKAGKVASTTAVTFQQTRAAWENFKISVGNSNVLQSTFSALAKGAAELVKSLDKIAEAGGVRKYNISQGIAEEIEYLKAQGMASKEIATMMVKKASDYFETGNAFPLTSQTDLMTKRGTLNESKAADYFNQLYKAAKELAEEQNKVTDAVNATGNALGENADATEKALNGAIPLLEEQIKKLNEKKQTLTDINEIAAANTQIEALEDELDSLKQVNAEYIKQRELLKENALIKIKPDDVNASVATTGNGLDEAAKQYFDDSIKAGEQAAEAFRNQVATIEESAQSFQNAIASGFGNTLSYLADCIAGVEDMDAGKMLQTLLDPLANAAITAGTLIMTTGQGIEALRDALTGFFGTGAIAAGAIMIGLGVAAKAGLAAIAKGSSRGNTYSSDYTYSGGYATDSVSAATSTAAVDVNVHGEISGQNISLVLDKYNNNKKR